MSNKLFDLVLQNDIKITSLKQSLSKQIHAYQQAFEGNKQQPFTINEDHYDFKQKMDEFKKQSQQFVNDLITIKKNTLIILQNFPQQQLWIKYSKDNDWNHFIDQFIPKIKN